VFTPEAVDRICDCAGGNPRVINMVCDGSLFIGYGKPKRKIDAAIVNQAMQDLGLYTPKEAKRTLSRPRWRPMYQVAAGLLLVTMALGLSIVLISDLPRRNEREGHGTSIAEKAAPSVLPNKTKVSRQSRVR
jgi:hypothetical protein